LPVHELGASRRERRGQGRSLCYHDYDTVREQRQRSPPVMMLRSRLFRAIVFSIRVGEPQQPTSYQRAKKVQHQSKRFSDDFGTCKCEDNVAHPVEHQHLKDVPLHTCFTAVVSIGLRVPWKLISSPRSAVKVAKYGRKPHLLPGSVDPVQIQSPDHWLCWSSGKSGKPEGESSQHRQPTPHVVDHVNKTWRVPQGHGTSRPEHNASARWI
jgi:hypothetical protein